MIGFYREALNHARKVDYKRLNYSYNGLGNHFENEFVAGIELIERIELNIQHRRTP